MKKLLFITMIFVFGCFSSQDLSYNLLHKDDSGPIYGKRESLSDIWIKTISKKKDKNGKFTKSNEISLLYNCDCEKNRYKLSYDVLYEDVNPESFMQLVLDYTCQNVDFNLIGSTEEDFIYYASAAVKKGKMYDVWIKSKSIKNNEGDTITNMTIFDPKTGKIIKSNESVMIIDTYKISKYRVNCDNNKIGKIVDFVYKTKNDQLHTLPIYFDNLGMRNAEYEEDRLIIRNVCTKPY